ncbi:MAG: DSBA oxidoreductase [Candidatus Shapirobacteria bacterium GW2011_GWE1_38_10]|uniref:DSBA oxidoreductase n=1 Tax=Candidatus Shapirobacteria bacterium GW2011_GWE1_38_10 TaxID=1618488 RepID=A0A0G0IBI8_9BACT|nr:MAG: DSBA oxidoreductase [Candidatus Shapirobacteria bacterium GW2011_GWE1_38_10]
MTENKFHPIVTPVLVILLIIGSFFLGSLTTRVKLLEKGGTTPGAQAPANGQAQAPQPERPTKGVATIDDDPILGDKNAPITIIEFSDYECPFCKRHFTDTYPKLIKEYIDTGKARLVFRDFPLSFHDPMATKEAIAANCAKDQGGDKKYFEFHGEIFKRTTSNGNGLDDAKLKTIATDLKLNMNSFNTCLTNKAMEDEVKKDLADGSAAGASGTPTFLIGKTTADGKVDGDLLIGAQPFAAFQAVIDPLLQ